MERYFICFNEAGRGTGRRPNSNETLLSYAKDCLDDPTETIEEINLDEITGWTGVMTLHVLWCIHREVTAMTFFAEIEVPNGTTGIDAEMGPVFDGDLAEITFL